MKKTLSYFMHPWLVLMIISMGLVNSTTLSIKLDEKNMWKNMSNAASKIPRAHEDLAFTLCVVNGATTLIYCIADSVSEAGPLDTIYSLRDKLETSNICSGVLTCVGGAGFIGAASAGILLLKNNDGYRASWHSLLFSLSFLYAYALGKKLKGNSTMLHEKIAQKNHS